MVPPHGASSWCLLWLLQVLGTLLPPSPHATDVQPPGSGAREGGACSRHMRRPLGAGFEAPSTHTLPARSLPTDASHQPTSLAPDRPDRGLAPPTNPGYAAGLASQQQALGGLSRPGVGPGGRLACRPADSGAAPGQRMGAQGRAGVRQGIAARSPSALPSPCRCCRGRGRCCPGGAGAAPPDSRAEQEQGGLSEAAWGWEG